MPSVSHRLADHFTRAEMACKCGCGAHEVSPVLVERLERLRRGLGRALVVVSGRRCEAHNQAVGGVTASEHLTGEAVDVACASPRERFELLEEALRTGFDRVGIGKNFVHLGIRAVPSQVVWLYPLPAHN